MERVTTRGALEKLMMPSNANFIIFRSGNFVVPANRAERAYGTVHCWNPIHPNIPRM